MAPHQQTAYHILEEEGKCSPTAKHGGNGVAKLQTADVSENPGIVKFLNLMGLQLKQPRLNSDNSEGLCGNKKINIPSGAGLRECRVVIFGATCDICGRSFKCVTDVKIHKFWRHTNLLDTAKRRRTVKNVERKGGTCGECGAWFKTVAGLKSHRKIAHSKRNKGMVRIVLRIGDEVMARISMKRRHLRVRTRESATQVDLNNSHPALAGSNDNSNVDIDSSHLDNNIGACGTSIACTVETANRYCDDDFVSAKRAKLDESYLQAENQIEESLKASDLAILLSLYRKSGATKNIDLPTVASSTSELADNEKTKQQEELTNLPAVQDVSDGQAVTVPEKLPKQTSQLDSHDAPSGTPEKIIDDEVQEVLRINRGGKTKDNTEINHESPNRCEREMLLSDAIKQMIRMEQEVYNAIERQRKNQNQRKATKRKKNINVDKSTEIVRALNAPEKLNALGIRVFPTVERETEVASLMDANSSDKYPMSPEANLNVSLEELNQYGINYYNETFEINNNMEK